MFQTFNLVSALSAQENLEAALVPLRVSAATRRQRGRGRPRRCRSPRRLRHLPGELPGGQQQRVAITRALVKEPKVLLAGEPAGNLDVDTREEIIGLLEAMWREHGLTMVIVTHDSAAARHAQRIGIMKNGRLAFKQPAPVHPAPFSRSGFGRPVFSRRAFPARTSRPPVPSRLTDQPALTAVPPGTIAPEDKQCNLVYFFSAAN